MFSSFLSFRVDGFSDELRYLRIPENVSDTQWEIVNECFHIVMIAKNELPYEAECADGYKNVFLSHFKIQNLHSGAT